MKLTVFIWQILLALWEILELFVWSHIESPYQFPGFPTQLFPNRDLLKNGYQHILFFIEEVSMVRILSN